MVFFDHFKIFDHLAFDILIFLPDNDFKGTQL